MFHSSSPSKNNSASPCAICLAFISIISNQFDYSHFVNFAVENFECKHSISYQRRRQYLVNNHIIAVYMEYHRQFLISYHKGFGFRMI